MRKADLILERRLFKIGVYVGFERVGQVNFNLGHRRVKGNVTFQTDDLKLAVQLLAVPTKCSWLELCRRLTCGITLETGGRYTFRFTEVPSREGRGRDRRLLKCMERA